MSLSSFPHAIINSFKRLLWAVTGAFYDGDLSGPISCSIRFDTDGTVEEVATTSGVSARGTWWTGAPDTDVGDDYEVRALSAGAVGTWTSAAAADDTWVALTAQRVWTVTKAGGSGTTAATRTWEIRRIGTTAPVISGAKTVTAEIII